MLCWRFCRSAYPGSIAGGIIPPTAAVSRPFKSVAQPCGSVTAKQYLPYVPFQRQLLSNHFQDHGAQNSVQKGRYHWPGPSESPLLLSRLAPPRILPFLSGLAVTQSSTRRYLIRNPIIWRSHATAHDATEIFLQPLDPWCRRQSIKRGFAISLPILVLYVLLYLLHFVPQESELRRHYMSTVARFWTYRRHEGFQNIASLGTYVTSQFTHDRLIHLVIDSVVLVGVASILSPVFSCRTFFAVYVCGGFLAAAADCAWAQLTNPCRNFTQAQVDQCSRSHHLITETRAKVVKINRFSFFTEKGLNEIRTNKGDIAEDHKEFQRLIKVLKTNLLYARNWIVWNIPNWAARGSLACLVTVATLIRPRTMITLMGVRSSVSLYNLTACFFLLNVSLEPVTGSRLNHRGCIAGNLAAVILWLLWLRKGRIGTLASGLRAFDQLNKPVRGSLLDRLIGSVCLPILTAHGLLVIGPQPAPQPANETANTLPPRDPETKTPNDNEKQKDTPTAENKDNSSGNDKN